MPFTHSERMIRCFQRCAQSIVAEHHPDDKGMKYVIRIVGGRFTGVEIHCPTLESTNKLFDELIDAYYAGVNHPYLMAV